MKNNLTKSAVATLTAIFLLSSANAQQQAPAAADAGNSEIDNLVNLGAGVQEIKKENGQLKSLKVIGQARIPSSLGASAGVMFATKKAKSSAQQEYIEWIKSNVKSIHTSGTETVVSLEGGSNGPTESGKSNETDTNSVTTQAEGLVRGLTLIGKKVDPSTQMLSLVFGWSVSTANMTRQAEDANNQTSAGTVETPTASGGGVPVNTAVKAQTVVSPAIKDF